MKPEHPATAIQLELEPFFILLNRATGMIGKAYD
jgi:hypothetical protein